MASQWLTPQVQVQRAVDPVDPLVVPDMTFDVAQMQETHAEAPSLLDISQPDQEAGDHLVLVVALRAVAKAGLADPEGPACQRDAEAPSFHRRFGQLAALGWPCHFFPTASFSRSFYMLRSANMRFRRRFASSRDFIWLIMDASMPPYLARHL